jgi:hypothetical protein
MTKIPGKSLSNTLASPDVRSLAEAALAPHIVLDREQYRARYFFL